MVSGSSKSLNNCELLLYYYWKRHRAGKRDPQRQTGIEGKLLWNGDSNLCSGANQLCGVGQVP